MLPQQRLSQLRSQSPLQSKHTFFHGLLSHSYVQNQRNEWSNLKCDASMKKYKYSHMSLLKNTSGCWNLHNRHRSTRWIEGLEAWWGKHTHIHAFGQNTLTKSSGRGLRYGPTSTLFFGASKGKTWLFIPFKGTQGRAENEGDAVCPFCLVSTWIETEKDSNFPNSYCISYANIWTSHFFQ